MSVFAWARWRQLDGPMLYECLRLARDASLTALSESIPELLA
jgi:hypothetical protein